MARFAVYYIPQKSKLYDTGSSLVGYDIRGQQTVAQPAFTKPEWAPDHGQFGFHVTITDAVDVDDDQIEVISSRIADLLKCFRPGLEYTLTPDRIGFWRDSSNAAVMVLRPNRSVEMLHDVLVTDLHSRGKGSDYTRRYAANPGAFTSETDIHRVKTLFGPYIFDDFVPHFTCLESFTGSGQERAAMEDELRKTLAGVDTLTLDTVCLVVQRDGEEHFSIYKEFSLHGDQ